MITKKHLFFSLFILSTNAVHGAFGWGWLASPWALRELTPAEALQKKEETKQEKAREKAAARAEALKEKRAVAKAAFYYQLHHEKAWWPDLSCVKPSHHHKCIQAIQEKYGISGNIFQGSDLAKEAYTQLLIYFLRHNVAGNNPVTFMTYNYKTMTLNLNKILLHKLLCYACYELGHGNVFVFDQVIQNYKKFINEIIAKKKSTGLKNVPQDRIAQDFHSLLCFWFIKTINLESNSTNFEDNVGSCCCCW